MPVLPLIDLLILLGWTSILGGFVLKAIWITTSYRPTLFGLVPTDFLLMAGICLLFALALAARTWVKANESRLIGQRRLPDLDELPEGASGWGAGAAQAPAAVTDGRGSASKAAASS